MSSLPVHRLRPKLPWKCCHTTHSQPSAVRNLAYAATAPSGVSERLPPPARHGYGTRELSTPQSHSERGRMLAAALLSSSHTLSTTSEGDLEPPPPGGSQRPDDPEISDQEWEIRTGRAIYILQQTLPDFFSTGLVSSLDTPDVSHSAPAPTKSSWSLPVTSLLGLRRPNGTANGKGKAKEEDETESIYSPRVRLSYTPPTPLPTPLPKTLHIEGLHMYIASSIFVRHTLNALYTDLHVDIRNVRVHGTKQKSESSQLGGPPAPRPKRSNRSARDKSVQLGLTVAGLGRVSGAPIEWQVNCTYTFSPLTGLIIHHNVDSIEPAPTQALFEALGKFGLVGGSLDEGGKPGGVGPM